MIVATFNVSTITGRIMEVAEMMVRGKTDVLSLQEIRWTDQRARDLRIFVIVLEVRHRYT